VQTTTHSLYATAAGPKELFVTDGATHMDLYDGDGVDLAMNKLSPFFKKNLVQASEELQDSHEEE
jgi:fermentation-respiration switch protein FrsA (DUF1100 family)